MTTQLGALARASAEDLQARIERDALRGVLAFARRGIRGELIIQVMANGSVDVALAPKQQARDSRWTIIDLDDITAQRLIRDARELGL